MIELVLMGIEQKRGKNIEQSNQSQPNQCAKADGAICWTHPEVVLHVLKLLGHGHLRPHEAVRQAGDHDGARVEHGVEGLVLAVQADLVEVATARLVADILGDDT